MTRPAARPLADSDDPPSLTPAHEGSNPWKSATCAEAWPATSSCPVTRPGTPRDRRGTSPSTSGPSPSCTPSRRTTSRRPSRFAAEHGLRIAFNAGGHNAGPIDWTEPTLLLKTERMTRDRGRRRSRGAPGSRPACCRKPLADAAGEHGLAYLAGHVAERRRARLRARGRAQLADPDARARLQQHRRGRGRHGRRPPVHADRDTEPELFWAIRGGGGNVAAVTAIELELYPIPEIYAGAPVLADRARDRGPQRVADVDRDRARGVRIPRADAAAARRAVPPRAPARPRRSCWSRSRSPGPPPTATRSSSRCGTSVRSSTRSG